MTPTTTKVYVGHCAEGHAERKVVLRVDDGNRNNEHSAKMVRCAECGSITRCEPDATKVKEVLSE